MKFLNSILILSALTLNTVRGDVKYFNNCINDGDFAITFDDGPHSEYTEKVLDVLDEFNVKATFFVNGKNCVDITSDKHAQELLKREYNSGHIIGSHTFTHPYGITHLSDEELTNELTKLNDALYDIIGVKPNFFRPPLGEFSESNLKVIEECGIKANILWNLDSEDWNPDYNATQQYIDGLEGKKASSRSFIALNHDIQKVTAEKNLRIVIPYIRSLGYNLVTMDECTGLPPYQGMSPTKDRSGNGKNNNGKITKDPNDDIIIDNQQQNLNANNTDTTNTQLPTNTTTTTTNTTTTTDATSGSSMVKPSFFTGSAILAAISYFLF